MTMTMRERITDDMVERAARIISPNCVWDEQINTHLERRKDNARTKARAALEAALAPAIPKRLSPRSFQALRAMAGATEAKPVLPKRHLFRRDAADYLVAHGLANYRGYNGISHGGYWLTDAGRALLTDGEYSNDG